MWKMMAALWYSEADKSKKFNKLREKIYLLIKHDYF